MKFDNDNLFILVLLVILVVLLNIVEAYFILSAIEELKQLL